MEEIARKELEAIRGMVFNWKNAYLRETPTEGDGEFLVEDFAQEIQTFVYPYLRRLYETKYLSEAEGEDFLEFCYGEVEDLRKSLRNVSNP